MSASQAPAVFEALIPETLMQAERVSEDARRAVLQLLVDEIGRGGLTPAVIDGAMVGLVQIASWDMERPQLAAWFRSMAANIEAGIKDKAA